MRLPVMRQPIAPIAILLGAALAGACRTADHTIGTVEPTGGDIVTVRSALGTPLGLREVKPDIVWGGRGVSITIDPTNADVAIAAAEVAGLFRTFDAGVHWQHIDNFIPYRMAEVRWSPSNPSVVIATVLADMHTVSQAGIWRSTDGGTTWKKPATAVPPGCPRAAAWGIAYAPDSNFVYVGTDCGVAVSSDLGATWTHVSPTGSPIRVKTVVAQPNNLLAVLSQIGFHRSPDNGNTWPTAGIGPLGIVDDARYHMRTLTATPVSPDVYISVTFGTGGVLQAFESDDGGGTWNNLNSPVNGNGRPAYVVVHASRDGDPNHFDLYWGNSVTDWRQTCTGTSGQRCGTTWESVHTAHTDNADIAYATGNNCPNYVIGDGGIMRTGDCGLNWMMVGTGPNGWGALQLFDAIGTVNSNHTDLYFATQDNGLWASANDGDTWPRAVGAEGFNIEAQHDSATDDQTVAGRAVCCNAEQLFKQNAHWMLDPETPWKSPPQGAAASDPVQVEPRVWLQFAQTAPSTVNALYISVDDGDTWNPVAGATIAESIGPGLPTFWRGRVAGPVATPTLYLPITRANNTTGLKKITGIRGGGTAAVANADNTLVDIGIAHVGTAQPVWNVDRHDSSRLYAFDAGAGKVKFSSDGGTTWPTDAPLSSLVSGNGQFLLAPHSTAGFGFNENRQVTAFGFDDQDGRRVLTGTEANGVFASFDRGASWAHVQGSELIPVITSFFFDQRVADVYFSSYSRGLWKMGWCSAGGADATPPTFTFVPPDITTESCGAVNIGTARAVDVCGAAAVTVTNNAPARFTPGTTVVTWTARDATGNTVTATQRVTLVLGDDPACCPAGTNIILGTSNNDTLNGTAGSDCILGRGAQDVINGNGGNDFISGGDGDDRIDGGGGNDVIFGGSGQDIITGGIGDDNLFGGDGDDRLSGGAGNDTLHGGQGQDTLLGEDNDDTLFGDDGSDNLDGGNGNDNLIGGPGTNVCAGGAGTNTFTSCAAPVADSCVDGAQNGTETALDCGGGCATKCASGQACVSANDCANGLCSASVCRPSDGPAGNFAGLVQASRQITSDFGSGYCAVLRIINNAAVPTTNWSVVVNLNGSTTYTTWNGGFTGSSGTITVTPAAASNQAVPPGATDASVGFCANRNNPNSGLLPIVVSATGSY
jgi:Ca2+-binding RTX toxin-like protein